MVHSSYLELDCKTGLRQGKTSSLDTVTKIIKSEGPLERREACRHWAFPKRYSPLALTRRQHNQAASSTDLSHHESHGPRRRIQQNTVRPNLNLAYNREDTKSNQLWLVAHHKHPHHITGTLHKSTPTKSIPRQPSLTQKLTNRNV